MAKKYRGRIPRSEGWELVGSVQSVGYEFGVYEKALRDKGTGELTGYAYWKVVLEQGKKLPKANYWLTIRYADAYVVHGGDAKKMRDNMPELYDRVVELCKDLYQ